MHTAIPDKTKEGPDGPFFDFGGEGGIVSVEYHNTNEINTFSHF